MITAFLNGSELPQLEVPFLRTPIEMSADVVTLSNDMYTDFVNNLKAGWSMSWASLTEDEYNAIYAIYEWQFTNNDYPLLDIPYYGVTDIPVRMTINTKDIWKNCGDVQNVTISLRETSPLSGGSS